MDDLLEVYVELTQRDQWILGHGSCKTLPQMALLWEDESRRLPFLNDETFSTADIYLYIHLSIYTVYRPLQSSAGASFVGGFYSDIASFWADSESRSHSMPVRVSVSRWFLPVRHSSRFCVLQYVSIRSFSFKWAAVVFVKDPDPEVNAIVLVLSLFNAHKTQQKQSWISVCVCHSEILSWGW